MPDRLPESEERLMHWHTFFGPDLGDLFAATSWPALRRAAESDGDPLGARLAPAARIRLRALLRLFETWRSTRGSEPTRLTSVADVIALIHPRCSSLYESTVWLLATDPDGCLTNEVVVQMGPAPMPPPHAHALLRHAIVKAAHIGWVVEYRPCEALVVDAVTRDAFTTLSTVAASIGLDIRDWVLLGQTEALSVADAYANAKAPAIALVA